MDEIFSAACTLQYHLKRKKWWGPHHTTDKYPFMYRRVLTRDFHAKGASMALRLSFHKEHDLVLVNGNSCVKQVILNRPKKLNSLNYEMVSRLGRVLGTYENDPSIKLVIIKANGRAFCAGADIVATIGSSLLGHWSFVGRFYRKQYHLDYLVATYKKPLVCLIDGIVMGGGAGLTMNAEFKIVTEKTVFAMPEVSLGLFPDVGASYFLSRLPGYFGEYLGLTEARLNGAEMVACGLATHFVPSKDLHLLEMELLAAAPSNGSAINILIDKFAENSYVKEDSSFKRLEIINRCFSQDTVEGILRSLENEVTNREEKWIVHAINSMKSCCPSSLKIFLKTIREGRMQNLEQCLVREYHVVGHIMQRSFSGDYYEGCRAKIFDKDNKPKWEPSSLELVSKEMVDRYFSTSLDKEYWEPLDFSSRRHNPLTQLKPKL